MDADRLAATRWAFGGTDPENDEWAYIIATPPNPDGRSEFVGWCSAKIIGRVIADHNERDELAAEVARLTPPTHKSVKSRDELAAEAESLRREADANTAIIRRLDERIARLLATLAEQTDAKVAAQDKLATATATIGRLRTALEDVEWAGEDSVAGRVCLNCLAPEWAGGHEVGCEVGRILGHAGPPTTFRLAEAP